MRLATINHRGRSRVAVVRGGTVDPVPIGPDWPISMEEVVRSPERWLPRLHSVPELGSIALDEVVLEAPLRPSNIIAIGLNYVDHAVETNLQPPEHPLVFAKLTSSIIGHGHPISWDPALTTEVDFEAELAVVIGRHARDVDPLRSLDYVFGYTCLNDVSARDLQFSDGQWVRAKSLDTFCPLGPWVVTVDELPDPTGLSLECVVSGETMQSATSRDMIFGVAELIARLSRSFTLQPGDVIATGTPSGAGYFRQPKRLLKDGDSVTVRIAGIGELTNAVQVRSAL